MRFVRRGMIAFDIVCEAWHDTSSYLEVNLMSYEINGIVQYNASELKHILGTGDAIVIDVRTPEEYQSGHIPGVPLHPMQQIAEWVGELNPDKPYVFVCRSGNRSQHVASVLKANGFHHVANYDGGMLVWDGDIE